MSSSLPLRCDGCGAFADWRDGAPGESMPCPRCGAGLDVPLDPPPHPIPWEDRRLNVLRRWWRTWDRALFHPLDFFRSIPFDGGRAAPTRYIVFFYLQFTLLVGAAIPITEAWKGRPPFTWSYALIFVFGAPLVCGAAVALIYLQAGVEHLCLRALGGRGRFDATFQVTAYTFPTVLYRGVPWVGKILHPLWGLACRTCGFAAAHGISKKRAFAGALLGEILSFAALVGVFWLIGSYLRFRYAPDVE